MYSYRRKSIIKAFKAGNFLSMSINNANKSSELEMKAAHKALNVKITWKQKQHKHTHTEKEN